MGKVNTTHKDMTKICIHCGRELDETRFPRNEKMKGGRRNDCRDCYNAARRRRYAENREKELAKNKEYREKNRDALNAARRKKYATDENYREKIKRRELERYYADIEESRRKSLERGKRYYKKTHPAPCFTATQLLKENPFEFND